MRSCRVVVFFILLCVSLCGLAANTKLTAVSAYDMGQYVRVVCEVNHSVSYHAFDLSHPDRVVIDLDATTLASTVHLPAFKHVTWIQGMRSGPQGKQSSRLVLDLTKSVKVKSFSTKHAAGGEHLVFDLYPETTTLVTKVAGLAKDNLRDVRVVLDPGHGGKDSGAVGLDETYEKNVVLAIAKYLKGYVDDTPGMKAYMTRSGDTFVLLRGRLEIARKDKADLFVAIHADNFKDSRVKGMTVFALSQKGATSEAARWLAKKENVSELMGGVELSDKSAALRSVLLDLSLSANINRSLKLGNDVLHDLDGVSQLHHSHVDQARFVVLKSPDIPSILVETGFLSNRYEETHLRKAWYQKKVAYAIYKGIKQYLYENPPPNTKILSWVREQAISYVVKGGDSLSSIAKEFNSSISSIKSKNGLKTTHIHIGQKLIV
jgi:N-acetylmuramoyl-L-alanine amidase